MHLVSKTNLFDVSSEYKSIIYVDLPTFSISEFSSLRKKQWVCKYNIIDDIPGMINLSSDLENECIVNCLFKC